MNAPYLVLNHGRPANGNLAGMQRQRYSEIPAILSLWDLPYWCRPVSAMANPVARYVEDSGRCDSRQYPPAYAAAADQTIAVLKHVAGYPM
jgi:hypothetical protein